MLWRKRKAARIPNMLIYYPPIDCHNIIEALMNSITSSNERQSTITILEQGCMHYQALMIDELQCCLEGSSYLDAS